jgi:hypothetical protein
LDEHGFPDYNKLGKEIFVKNIKDLIGEIERDDHDGGCNTIHLLEGLFGFVSTSIILV